jgi:hypothetical protein
MGIGMKTHHAGAIVAAVLATAGCDAAAGPGAPGGFEAAMDAHYYGALADADVVAEPVKPGFATVENGGYHFDTIAPGNWRITQTVSGEGRRRVSQQCYSTPRRIAQLVDLRSTFDRSRDCQFEMDKLANGYAVRYVCENGSRRANAAARITGDFTRRYMVETKINMSGTSNRRAETITTTTTAERAGDC